MKCEECGCHMAYKLTAVQIGCDETVNMCDDCLGNFEQCEGCDVVLHYLDIPSAPPDGITICPECRSVESFTHLGD